MDVDFTAAKDGWDNIFATHKRTVTRTPVTKTTDGVTGDETLTDGSADSSYECILIRMEDKWALDNPGLIQNADAIVLVDEAQTLNKDDKITEQGETYRVDSIKTDYMGEIAFLRIARCFKV